LGDGSIGLLFFGFLGAAWLGWLVLFGALWSRSNGSIAFRNLYRCLFAGTFLELLLTIPVDVQVRKRTTCYCGEGTFAALTFGMFVALWLFGPGLLLLFFLRREQRLRRVGFCRECGLDLRDTTDTRCPECTGLVQRALT
jgi:hypothetical protein